METIRKLTKAIMMLEWQTKILLIFLLYVMAGVNTYNSNSSIVEKIDLTSEENKILKYQDLPKEVMGVIEAYITSKSEKIYDELSFCNLDSGCINARYYRSGDPGIYYRGIHFVVGNNEFYNLKNPPPPFILFEKKLYHPLKEYNLHVLRTFPHAISFDEVTYIQFDLSKYLEY